MSRASKLFRIFSAVCLSLFLCSSLCACGSSRYSTGSNKNTANTVNTSSSSNANKSSNSSSNKNTNSSSSHKTYSDSRWPTTNKELLAVPEEERWYNAWDSVGTNCTIVGKVADVYQATDEDGMPIFVDIGVAYPSENAVTLVVWARDLDGYEETLEAIDHGNAWISVTSYLGTYNGHLQFSSDNYVEWTYWTGVS